MTTGKAHSHLSELFDRRLLIFAGKVFNVTMPIDGIRAVCAVAHYWMTDVEEMRSKSSDDYLRTVSCSHRCQRAKKKHCNVLVNVDDPIWNVTFEKFQFAVFVAFAELPSNKF